MPRAGQHRSTQRKSPKGRADDAALTADIVALATEYGRYGYRRITALLRAAGWAVNVKRVERSARRPAELPAVRRAAARRRGAGRDDALPLPGRARPARADGAPAGGGRRAARGPGAGAEARHADRREPGRGRRRRAQGSGRGAGDGGARGGVRGAAGQGLLRLQGASGGGRGLRAGAARDPDAGERQRERGGRRAAVGDEAAVYADKGYDSAARRALLAERGVFDGIMRLATRRSRASPRVARSAPSRPAGCGAWRR